MKRKTKPQHEAEQKAALLQRVRDIYSGAAGMEWDSDESWPGANELSRIVPAVRGLFVTDDYEFLVAPSNLGEYDTPEKLAEFLFRYGVRT